jgi:RNA polymerase sigma-70 factor (ECF subfamily)
VGPAVDAAGLASPAETIESMSMVLSILASMVSSPSKDRQTPAEAPDSETVTRWIERCCDGDMTAFRRLYDEYLPYVRRNVKRLLGPSAEVDDVIQEVFVNVHQSLSSFNHNSKFETWLYRVTRNVTISHLRGQKKTVDLADLQPLRANARTFSKLEARDQVKTLYAVLNQVSAESREAFVLYEVEEMKLREIAELTDTSINTISARVRRTRERLRTFLEATLSEVSDD